MRFKKLATSVAVLGLAGGMVVAASGIAAAESTSIYPYIDLSFGTNDHQDVAQIGSTDPGQADSALCISNGANASGGNIDDTTPGHLRSDAHYSGKVNGTVVNAASQLDQLLVLQDFLTATPVCTASAIALTATGSNVVDNIKHKGTDTITTTADVQPGILATSVTYIRVHCDSGQIVTTPSGGAIVDGVSITNNTKSATCNSNSSTVDFVLKPLTIKIKPSLNLAACNDVDNVVSNTVADDLSNERTNELDNSNALHSYSPANAATKNLITIRECAENTANVPGKPLATKVAVAGAGTDTIDIMKAKTINPQLWDTTRGATCSDAKATDTVSAVAYGARVFICKGNYGIQIPFTIVVRAPDPASASIDVKGLLHPAPPMTVASSSMTIS